MADMNLKEILTTIVQTPMLHGRFLNTLSYLENCGARLLAKCEHPTMVREEMLKHAAEEFRHAYYLKMMIRRVSEESLAGYCIHELLGDYRALHFLSALNVFTSRLLKKHGYTSILLKGAAYGLVSYAIEVRAKQLYPSYQNILKKYCPRVSVRTIIIEEEQHLAEMEKEIDSLANGWDLARMVCHKEKELTKAWFSALAAECQAALQPKKLQV